MQSETNSDDTRPNTSNTNFLSKIGGFFKGIGEKIKNLFNRIRRPKDDEETAPKDEEEEIEIPEIYLPETTEDLIWVLKKLPSEVITKEQKSRIAGVMSFEHRRVSDIMTPKDQAVFVYENDFLGPLMLDKLYKSGLQHFPVLDTHGNVTGMLHTAQLNSLEIRETDRASSFIDKTVYYVRDDYSLEMAMAAFSRTGSHFFIVVNPRGDMRGVLPFSAVVESLIGFVPKDDFAEDTNVALVSRRQNGNGPFVPKSDYRPVQSVGAARRTPGTAPLYPPRPTDVPTSYDS
ncbi:MAG: hypothetical protein Q4E47_02415 [Candidatus Saccharibacteria bacterium]|nr:hypothetical protein [Candidatus Saccharibacteria bacterium]